MLYTDTHRVSSACVEVLNAHIKVILYFACGSVPLLRMAGTRFSLPVLPNAWAGLVRVITRHVPRQRYDMGKEFKDGK